MYLNASALLNRLIKEQINMQSDQVTQARASRDFLLNKIKSLSANNSSSLTFASIYNLHYGSFARKTKIHPIDDIDLMIGLRGGLFEYNSNEISDYKNVIIRPQNNINIGHWQNCIDNDINNKQYLNSRKVLEELKRNLQNFGHYRKAEMHRKQQAVTLQLDSYPWNFDIVPCFYNDKNDWYFIPNGNGHWMITNPKKDQEYITNVNKNSSSRALGIIRLLKYWNKQNKQLFPSYLLEIFVANYLEKTSFFLNDTHSLFLGVLKYIRDNLYNPIYDPKNIEGDINQLDIDQYMNIYSTITNHIELLEPDSSPIYGWLVLEPFPIQNLKEIFNYEFPNY